jgi:drug/metabolite transporter (DMT)-like permease
VPGLTRRLPECYGPPVTRPNKVSDRVFAVLLVLSMVAWGGTWTSAKLIAGSASLELVVFWRFLLTTASLALVLAAAREPLALPWKIMPGLAAAAALMTAYNHFFFGGVRDGLAGTGGVLVASLNPVLTFIAMRALERRRPSAVEMGGVALGIAGGAILLQIWRFDGRELAGGNLFFLLAAASWSALTLLSQRVQRHVGFLAYSFYVNAFSTVMNLPWAIRDGLAVRVEHPGAFWLNLAYLSFVGTSFATTVFFRASRRLGAQRASSFVFLVPALAPLLSWLVIGETPERATLLGGPLAVLAVYLINRGGAGSSRARPGGGAECPGADRAGKVA